MKKLVISMLVCAMLAGLAGCSNDPAETSGESSSLESSTEVSTEVSTESSTESSAEQSVEESSEESAEGSTEDVKVTDSLDKIMETLYTGVSDKIATVVNTEITAENSAYFLGIENLEMEEGLASEPMMTSIAHSVCLVRVAEGTDMEALQTQVKENVDPNKWICVGVDPEKIIVDHIDNLMILIMNDEYGETIHENFLALAE